MKKQAELAGFGKASKINFPSGSAENGHVHANAFVLTMA